MSNTKKNNDDTNIKPVTPPPTPVQVRITDYTLLYSMFHTVLALFAIYLSFKCNNGFNLGSFLVALICPYIYLIYILATKGLCDNMETS